MDANNLKYFAAVAKYGSINQAAKSMFISQPQLSHIIRDLEEESGLTLFMRTSKGTKLTPDGEEFLRHCQVILGEMDNLRQFISSAKRERSRMAVSMTRFSHTAECFNEICRRHQNEPEFTLTLRENAPMNVIEDVADETVDLGVLHFSSGDAEIMRRNLESRKLEFTPLATFRPCVCISARHEALTAENRGGIAIEELEDYGFVRYCGQYEDFIYHIATQRGLVDLNESQRIIYVNDRQEQMRLISATNFYTIGIMEFSGQNSLYGVISVPLLNCTEMIRFGAVKKKGKKLTALEKELAAELKERYRKLMESEEERNGETKGKFTRSQEL